MSDWLLNIKVVSTNSSYQSYREREEAGMRSGQVQDGAYVPSRGLVRPLLLQSNWMGGSASCWKKEQQ